MLSEKEFLKKAYQYCETLPINRCNGCDECGLRCASNLPMTHEEFHAIHDFLEKMSPDLRGRLLNQNKAVNFGDGIFEKACLFRDMERRHCGIYSVRPLICRLFGLVMWLPCPTQKVPFAGKEALDLFLEYAAYPRNTYDNWIREQD